jgi:hypothetical protein
MAVGSFSPEISQALTVAPEVVYSPIVPAATRNDRKSCHTV